MCPCVCVCVQIGISPCKHLEVYRGKSCEDERDPPSVLYHLPSPTVSHTHTHTRFSISPSAFLSHVLVQIYCPLCDQLPRPSVSQRRGGNTVKQSHITTPLLITGGPRRVTVKLATQINTRNLRAERLSTLLISVRI